MGPVRPPALGLCSRHTRAARRRDCAAARERRYNSLRAGSIASFILGSVAGAFSCLRYGYLGFLLPVTLAGLSIFSAAVLWEEPREEWTVAKSPSTTIRVSAG